MPLDIDATRAQLSDSKGSKRASACKKLGKAIIADAKCATPELLGDLAARTRDRSDAVSMEACAALVSAGEAAVAPLIEMLQLDRLPHTAEEVTDDDSIAHSNISQALGQIDDARAVPALFAVASSMSRGNTGAICGLTDLAGRQAAGKAAVEALTKLAREGASADAAISEQAQNALDELKGDHEEVQAAISGGAVEERNELGRTPLYLAAESFSLASLELLIKEGADVNAADCNGYTPVIALIDKASRYGKIPDEARQCLDALLAAGADVNARTKTQQTAIFLVVDLKMTKALLKAGADVQVQDEEGWTPLHGIVFRGKVPIAKLLIKEGADVNAENAKGKPPAGMLSTNRKKMEALLVEHGATV